MGKTGKESDKDYRPLQRTEPNGRGSRACKLHHPKSERIRSYQADLQTQIRFQFPQSRSRNEASIPYQHLQNVRHSRRNSQARLRSMPCPKRREAKDKKETQQVLLYPRRNHVRHTAGQLPHRTTTNAWRAAKQLESRQDKEKSHC